MRALFGVVSLLIVLAVVGWTATAAWRAGRPAPTAARAASAGGSAATAPSQQVINDLDAALRQGQARNDDAERRDAAAAAADPAARPGGAGSAP